MPHMQIKPSKALSGFIKHYLILENNASVVSSMRLFSDGNTGVVFCTDGTLATASINNKIDNLPDAFVYGQISGYRDIIGRGKAALFIVVFHPDGLKQLINLPASETRDQIVPFKDLFGVSGDMLAEALFNCKSATEKILLIEEFFMKILIDNWAPTDNLVTAAIDYIVKKKGMTTISNLADFSGYHARHLERRFVDAVGLSPKRFCGIVRLHTFLKHFKSDSGDKNIAHYGYEAGYYDQAHLIREFKNITGITPSQYIRQANPLAVNFLQLLA
jgi:AraC-like DNA-binding protein